MTLSADNDMDVVAFNDIVVIAQDIWASFLDLPLEPVPADTVDVTAMRIVGGIVTVFDAWSGAVQLEVSRPFAEIAAKRMFASDGAVSDVEVDDALGELTNMIGGNIKSLLPAPSSRARLASPATRSRMSAPSGPTSTRSTSSRTMRACSAGNSSSHSGSKCASPSRTSASVRSGTSARAARQVPTMISG